MSHRLIVARVDWFDDAGWKHIVDHFRIAAWFAKESGLKRILFDTEPYPHDAQVIPFDYRRQTVRKVSIRK